MDDIVKIVKPLESSCLLINGATETVKHEMKKQKCGFLGAMMAPVPSSLIQSVAPSLINAISGKGVMGVTKRWISSIINISFNDKRHAW